MCLLRKKINGYLLKLLSGKRINNDNYFMSRKLFAVILYLMCVLGGFAQDIEVKKFEPLEKDQTAALSPRKDINGVTCGLVKVLLKEPGAEFEGSAAGVDDL